MNITNMIDIDEEDFIDECDDIYLSDKKTINYSENNDIYDKINSKIKHYCTDVEVMDVNIDAFLNKYV